MIYLHDIDEHYTIHEFETLDFLAFDEDGLLMTFSDFDNFCGADATSDEQKEENISFEELFSDQDLIKKFVIVLGGRDFTTAGIVNVSDCNKENCYNRVEIWKLYSSIIEDVMSGKCIKLSDYDNGKIFWKRSHNDVPYVFDIFPEDFELM